jgi:NAD(P)-dependent dehydrogenase (short-subunit alcohol dehydrogenase family)
LHGGVVDLGLTDSVALVTGGAGRLGRAICTALAREGAQIGVVDRAASVRDVARELEAGGCRAHAVEADVSDRAAVERMLRDVTGALGPVDVLVNAHGIYPNVPLLEMDAAEWDQVFTVNTRGTMLTCQALGKQMVARGAAGSIVNISSAAAESPRAGGAAYCGSKAAVNLLTNVLAIELGPHGIRVNAVAPGLVLDQVFRPGDVHEYAYVTQSLEGIPLRRTGSPEDIAEAVLFLAGRNNPWMTGAIVPVTGGSHCGRTHVALSRGLR